MKREGLVDLLTTYSACGDSLNCILCPLRSNRKQKRVLEWVCKNDRKWCEKVLETLASLRVVGNEKNQSITAEKAREWKKTIEETLKATE